MRRLLVILALRVLLASLTLCCAGQNVLIGNRRLQASGNTIAIDATPTRYERLFPVLLPTAPAQAPTLSTASALVTTGNSGVQ